MIGKEMIQRRDQETQCPTADLSNDFSFIGDGQIILERPREEPCNRGLPVSSFPTLFE